MEYKNTNNDDWYPIDLHMHTINGVTGDGKTDFVSDFNYLNFITNIEKYGLKLISITNHNIICLKNFILCKYLCDRIKTNLLFGVELDSNTKLHKDYHLICIFNETLLNCLEIAKKINDITSFQKGNGKVRFETSDIIELIKKYKIIIVPHGDKDKGMLNRPTEPEIIEALGMIKDGFISVFDCASDWKLEKIKQFISDGGLFERIDKFGGVLFSDNRRWSAKDFKFNDFYMNAEPTFNGFLHSISNPTERFSLKDFLPNNNNYISKIEITGHDGSRIANCEIFLKNGFNCVIGKSGSGKSLLLYIIEKTLVPSTVDLENYAFLDKNEIKIYNEHGSLMNSNNTNVGIGESIFQKIIKVIGSGDNDSIYTIIDSIDKSFIKKEKFNSFISKYRMTLKDYVDRKKQLDYLMEEIKNELITFSTYNYELLKLSNIRFITFTFPQEKDFVYSENELDFLLSFREKAEELSKVVGIIKNNEDFKKDLLQSIKRINDSFSGVLNNIIKDKKSTEFYNKKINIVKKHLEHINSTISNNAGRKQYLINEMSRNIKVISKKIIDYYKICFLNKSTNLSINIDEINKKSSLDDSFGITVDEIVNSNSITKMNLKSNDLFPTRGIQQKLEPIEYDMTNNVNAKKVIDKYLECGDVLEKGLDDVMSNLKLETNVYFDKQNVKRLNPGDIAKKYINFYFSKELANGSNSIIIFDQIENDLDKEFISSEILKNIKNIKRKVQLIFVTHDPIIAVNADPINYIEAIKENNCIKYRDFVAESTVKDELKTIAKNVDGSIDVIRDRYEIYKGEGKYECRDNEGK